MQEKLALWMNRIDYNELLEGNNSSPHTLLGSHRVGKDQIFIAFRPEATQMWVLDEKTKQEILMVAMDDNGLFGLYWNGYIEKYQYKVAYQGDDIITIYDPYSFEPQISSVDLYLFAEGNHYEIYKKLGAHPMTMDGIEGTYFAVWAPHAKSVSVVGDFNMWDGRLYFMRRLDVSGVFELFIPGVGQGSTYKFLIKTQKGDTIFKADPYANGSRLRPHNESVIEDIRNYSWTDAKWMKRRRSFTRNQVVKEPMTIYEVHLGSWRRQEDGTEDGYYNYREIAKEMGAYLVEMGYTHVELMGIAEYPFDGSWGYQVTGYYTPTRRYGSPQDFMYFIDYMHSIGIHVILDWVPAHFPKDDHALARFDGEPLFEHPDPRRGEHPHWGTYIFNYAKKEVENFLIANALFWAKEYHVDGLRVDAVASMLYLDYGKEAGEWLPNEDGGSHNNEVVRMLRHLNTILEEDVPGFIMIAEESTAWAGVSAPVSKDGLGFQFKWNMGWMNDFTEYMKLDPLFRSGNHFKLCFSLMYAYSENFVQVLSHDEVVHGKGSMIRKMPGDRKAKFANLRTAYGFMYGHPGKKLLFMGQEFAQDREWSEARALDWELLEVEEHEQMRQYVKALNELYQKYSALYYNDCEEIGFEWMSCQNAEESTVAFVRRGESTKHQLLFVCNFTPVCRETYRVGVPCKGTYKPVFNSDSKRFGGNHLFKDRLVEAEAMEQDGRDYSIEMVLPPLSVVVFEYHYVKK